MNATTVTTSSRPPLGFTPHLGKDLLAGLVVSLVALPLCLGVALASGAPLMSGLIAGIVGGILVGLLSGSHTSVSGPAAGLTAIVATQIDKLGDFSTFLMALILAGGIQIALGIAKAGFIAAFCPSSVIKGLLAAIGIILILKQIPHLIGYDVEAFGDMAFEQKDGSNTLTDLIQSLFAWHGGAAIIGFACIGLLFAWDKIPTLKNTPVPAPLVAVLLGIGGNELFIRLNSSLAIDAEHLVQVPVAEGLQDLSGFLQFPNWGGLLSPTVYLAAITIAIVASLETLLNLEAVDRIDPQQRNSPPNKELFAQGVGNTVAGLIGGIPVTSVIVRSSVNINAGGKTRWSAIFHGCFLLAAVLLIPTLLNRIPLSCLAAILIVTGIKLASPQLFVKMRNSGRTQFLPFLATVLAIVLLDLLTGIIIGLLVSVAFILRSNFRRPLKKIVEKHTTGEVLRIQLANQVSFFNRPTLDKLLYSLPRGKHILLDARGTDFIDPDVLLLINDFRTKAAPVRGVQMSFLGFKDHYAPLEDTIQYMDHTSAEVQKSLQPQDVLQLLREGNQRFFLGQRMDRDLLRQVQATAPGQAPLAVILSCIDSRAPAEIIFDLGIGDVFSVRIAGNVARDKIIASMEYGCAVAGSRCLLVLGHTSCGAVTAAVDFFDKDQKPSEATGCIHLDGLLAEIQQSIEPHQHAPSAEHPVARRRYVDEVTRKNVLRTMRRIQEESPILNRLIREGQVAIYGGLYDVSTGVVDFFDSQGEALFPKRAFPEKGEAEDPTSQVLPASSQEAEAS